MTPLSILFSDALSMRRIVLTVSACLFFISISTTPSSAQATNDQIHGRIADRAGAALPGAIVTLSNLGTGLVTLCIGGGMGTATIIERV